MSPPLRRPGSSSNTPSAPTRCCTSLSRKASQWRTAGSQCPTGPASASLCVRISSKNTRCRHDRARRPPPSRCASHLPRFAGEESSRFLPRIAGEGTMRSMMEGARPMKALFLGNVAVDTYEGIKAELPPGLQNIVVLDPQEVRGRADVAAETDILVSNQWRADFPLAPNIRLVQSVTTGVELFDLAALPKGAAVCNSFGHETAIAEYVVMAWLALHHRFVQIAGEFRERSSWRSSWVQS